MSALKKITRQEAIDRLKAGMMVAVEVLIGRPYQIGIGRDSRTPIFLAELVWVEEGEQFIVSSIDEMLKLVRALKPVDKEYVEFFNGEFGSSMIDYACYEPTRGTIKPKDQIVEIVVDPYNWATAPGFEWIRDL